uniref:PDZ domain-containing protein n=1 Tax=Ditylenchus dipsaci TaxID=166011 RepID=A0A915DI28_9BILA
MGTLRSSQLEVLVDGCEWHRVSATLDETALCLSPVGDGFMPVADVPFAPMPTTAAAAAAWSAEKRFVRVVKPEGHGLGISIQGGADNDRPIVISKIFSGMAAQQTDQLFVGDVILAVNGESLVNSKHDEAVKALKRAGKVVNLQVQYKKDVHLKKDNVLQRLTWDDEERADPRNRQRSFGLKLAYVARTSLDREDIENRTIEIRSHSAHHVLTIRCANAFEADACTSSSQLNSRSKPTSSQDGWLAEQGVQDGLLAWRPVFAALTMNDLLFYDSVPAIKQEWACPKITRPLIATRVVQTTSRTFPVIAGLSDIISFTTRTGTQEGICSHICGSSECTLYLARSTINWTSHLQHPFEAIRATGDDGNQFLWIDFGPPVGEQEVDLRGSPKAVVFVLHSFLAAKVYRLNLYA